MTPTDFREARRKLGLTQVQAATLLGYGASTRVSEIECGERTPDKCKLRLLRAYLDGYRPADWPTATTERTKT